MATFITSKAVGETITIQVDTSTGRWKYYHNGSYSSVFIQNPMGQTITVANANGEFTIIPCLANGTVSGDVTTLASNDNQLTSFDSTGLTSLEELHLSQNQLTSFDGTGLTSLTELSLNENQLTSLDITGLSSLTYLDLSINQLTPSVNNQILNLLDQYGLENGEFYTTGGRTSVGTADYDALISKGWTFSGLDLIIPPTFITSKSVGETINIGVSTSTEYWKYNHDGSDSSVFADGYQNLTITNANGEFTIIPCLSDGTVSGGIITMNLGDPDISFGITSFDGTGLSSLTSLYLNSNQLTSFDGTGLSSLTQLNLDNNPLTSFISGDMGQIDFLNLNDLQLTSFDGTGLSSLTDLRLERNQLTSFDGTGLSSLTYLGLETNQLTSFDGTGLSSLDQLYLQSNQLTSFDGTGLSSLTTLILVNNQLTSIDGTGLSSLINLDLTGPKGGGGTLTSVSNLPTSLAQLFLGFNQLTSFNGIGLTSLTKLYLENNLLTSFDGTGLSSLIELALSDNQLTSLDGFIFPTGLTTLQLGNNQLTSIDVTGLSSLTTLGLRNNQLTPSINNQILNQLNQNGLSDGTFHSFYSSNGRTSASNTDYDNLVSLGWYFDGLNLIAVGNGKLRVKGVNSGGVPTQPWDGGTIYNIGAVVTHEGQTWNCIQYAPSGYGPFGGYIDVYWTL